MCSGVSCNRAVVVLLCSSRIQSSYAALQRINQDLEDKMHSTVRGSSGGVVSDVLTPRCLKTVPPVATVEQQSLLVFLRAITSSHGEGNQCPK